MKQNYIGVAETCRQDQETSNLICLALVKHSKTHIYLAVNKQVYTYTWSINVVSLVLWVLSLDVLQSYFFCK